MSPSSSPGEVPPDLAATPGHRRPANPYSFDKSRLCGFTDNVVSIALTLLVLDVRLPPGLTQLSFHEAFVLLGPRLASFLLSFFIVGVFWVGHHLMFGSFSRVTPHMLWLNNLFLLTISLIPASATLLGNFPGQRTAVVLYGVNLMLVGASLLVLLFNGLRYHRRQNLTLDEAIHRKGVVRLVPVLALAAIGIALAWINPWLSYGIYCTMPVLYIVVQLV